MSRGQIKIVRLEREIAGVVQNENTGVMMTSHVGKNVFHPFLASSVLVARWTI